MKQFIHKPKHLKTHRILPGHANGSRFAGETALPGVDRAERITRRHGWTERQATRRLQYGLGGHVGLIGAALALVVMLLAAVGPRPSVLAPPNAATDAATDVPTVQVVDAGSGHAAAADLEG